MKDEFDESTTKDEMRQRNAAFLAHFLRADMDGLDALSEVTVMGTPHRVIPGSQSLMVLFADVLLRLRVYGEAIEVLSQMALEAARDEAL